MSGQTVLDNETSGGLTVLDNHDNSDETVLEGSKADKNLNRVNLQSFLDYTIVRQLQTEGAEADIYLMEKDGESYILKLYRFGIEPKEEISKTLLELSSKFPDDIIRIHEIAIHPEMNRWYEIQEYARYGSLKDFDQSKLNSEGIKQVVREIHMMLHTMHTHNIIHRDLKPANILIREIEPLDLIMTDFGISSILDEEMSKKMTSKSGTRIYFAPESFSGVIGPEVDYWAFGIILLELMTGENIFKGINEGLIAYEIHTKGVKVPEELDDRIVYLLKGLLTRDPKKRWGGDEVNQWLRGSTKIALHYDYSQSSEDGFSKPYTFENQKYYTLQDLVAAFAQMNKNWQSGLAHYYRGYLSKWLENNQDFDTIIDLDRIKENTEDRDLALLEIITKYNRELEFILFGKLVNANNLLLFTGKFLNDTADETEEKIVNLLLYDELETYYKVYAKYAQKDEELAQLLYDLRRLPCNQTYKLRSNSTSATKKKLAKPYYDYMLYAVKKERIADNYLEKYILPLEYREWDIDYNSYTKQLEELEGFKQKYKLFTKEEFENLKNDKDILQILNLDILDEGMLTQELYTNLISVYKDKERYLILNKIIKETEKQNNEYYNTLTQYFKKLQNPSILWTNEDFWIVDKFKNVHDEIKSLHKTIEFKTSDKVWYMGLMYLFALTMLIAAPLGTNKDGFSYPLLISMVLVFLGFIVDSGHFYYRNGWLYHKNKLRYLLEMTIITWDYPKKRITSLVQTNFNHTIVKYDRRKKLSIAISLLITAIVISIAVKIIFYNKGERIYEEAQQGFSYSYEKSISKFHYSAKLGNTKAYNKLGDLYFNGETVDQNYTKAVYYYQQNMPYELRVDTPSKSKYAVVLFGTYCAIKNFLNHINDEDASHAETQLGYMYLNGFGVKQDYSKALKYFEAASKLDNATAINNLGFMYHNGYGVMKDSLKAKEYYQRASDLGNIQAKDNLKLFESPNERINKAGDEVSPALKDSTVAGLTAKAMQLHKQQKAEEVYNAGATLFEKGQYQSAFIKFEESAELGHLEASNRMGNMYRIGLGIEQDYIKAREAYGAASDKGHSWAQMNLGVLYEKGQGGDINFKKAFELYQKSASSGNPEGRLRLAMCYTAGWGVNQDISKAKEIYVSLADEGNKNAIEALKYFREKGL